MYNFVFFNTDPVQALPPHPPQNALYVSGEVAPAAGLELADHELLSVHAGRPAQQQTLGQVLLVECLKHILALWVGKGGACVCGGGAVEWVSEGVVGCGGDQSGMASN